MYLYEGDDILSNNDTYNFQICNSRERLAQWLEIPLQQLTFILYYKGPESFYNSFSIPKSNGAERIIHAPNGKLKDLQRSLFKKLGEHWCYVQKSENITSRIAHGFEKGKSIITNAQAHKNKRFIYNVDLENFFESFHFGRVRGFFHKNKYFQFPLDIATILAQISCYKGSLPQGAPSSPIITNLICQIFDIRVLKLTKKYRLDYTRYADDLTFSTNDPNFFDNLEKFHHELNTEVERAGFSINQKKTRLAQSHMQQKVTGLVVNEKVAVDSKFIRETRAMANSLYSTGEFTINGEKGTLNQLEGRFSFIQQLDSFHPKEEKGLPHFILNGRERQYQKFLFFQHFIANDKPVLLVEGKTDIVYLKSALKNLYKEYPTLISKDDRGNFQFHVTFLRRSRKLEYFFGFSRDGADAMKELYKYFIHQKNSKNTNYLGLFRNKYGIIPKKPVVFIFDNELQSERPLKKFLDAVVIDLKGKARTNSLKTLNGQLSEKLYCNLTFSQHLFVLTNPLVDGKSECEAEDLFSAEVRDTVIRGKKLSLKSDYNIEIHYGKEIFSQHIRENYKKIDFERFRPMLDSLVSLIAAYEQQYDKQLWEQREALYY